MQGQFVGGGTYGAVYLVELHLKQIVDVSTVTSDSSKSESDVTLSSSLLSRNSIGKTEEVRPIRKMEVTNSQLSKVAVKKFLNMSKSGDEDPLKYFRAELKLLHKLNRHPNVVKFYGACFEWPNLAIVMEYFPLKSLQEVLTNSQTHFRFYIFVTSRPRNLFIFFFFVLRLSFASFGLTCKCAIDISKGMLHIHAMDAIHRDLKSSNCLVNSISESSDVNVKIGDFGLSRFVSRTREGHTAKMTQGQGTIAYMAPEILKGDIYSKSSDVYSFGVILWELVNKFCTKLYSSPWSSQYSGNGDVELIKAIIQGRTLDLPTGKYPGCCVELVTHQSNQSI